MASKDKTEEDLTCPVCCDIYNHPVILSCTHSICKGCLQRFWKTKRSKECPICRRSSKAEPLTNLALKNLCETFLAERGLKTSLQSEEFCSLHNEKLKLFCLEDKQPVCAACRNSKKHKNHSCYTIEEAVQDHKEELLTALTTLKDKLKIFDKVKLTYDLTAEHIKVQAEHTERQITEEFEKLHQFLQDEETTRITALRKEEEQKSQMLKEKIEEIGREMSSISQKIRGIEEDLRAENILLLQNFKTTMKRAQCTLEDPQMFSGALINVAKHLGNLKFRVWEKMQQIFQYIPVILDPNTANPHLIVSEDLTSVRYSNDKQQLPDNPERFDSCICPCLLGSEGFNSGTHCWDVDVGYNSNWTLGVIAESVQRKGDSFHSGLWCVKYVNGEYKSHSPDQPETPLMVNKKLKKIRVQLDWGKGELSFSNPLTDTLLQTFTHTFTERFFPYFHSLSPLRILPMRSSVRLKEHSYPKECTIS